MRKEYFSLSAKVQIAPLFLLATLIGIAFYAPQALRLDQQSLADFVSVAVQRSERIAELDNALATAHAALYRALATAATDDAAAKRTAELNKAADAVARIPDALTAFQIADRGETIRQAAAEKLRASIAAYLAHVDAALERSGAAATSMASAADAERSFQETAKLIDELMFASRDGRDREVARAGVQIERQQFALSAVLLAMSLSGILVAYLTGRNVGRPVMAMAQMMRETRASAFDVGWQNSARRDALVPVTRTYQEPSGTLTVAAVEPQAQAVAPTVADRIERKVQYSGVIAAEIVQQARSAAAFNETQVRSAIRIGDVTQLITAISGQINLLALNATVESSRSGEAGRGFATAAQQVQAVAAQASKAAETMNRQIFGIRAADPQTAQREPSMAAGTESGADAVAGAGRNAGEI